MRNKIVLRTLSVVAAALVCAVWSLAGCSSPSSGFGDDNENVIARPTLSALTLSYADSAAPQGFLFDKDAFYYQLDVEKPRAGSQLSVSAEAAEGVTVDIVFDNGAVENGGTIKLPSTGETYKQLVITLSQAGAESSEYKIDFNPPQSVSVVDTSIRNLFIGYTPTSDNLMSGISGGGGTAVSTIRSALTAYVMVTASSSLANVKLSYGDQIASGTGSAEFQSITLPGIDETKDLTVVISSGNSANNSNYTIVVKGYIPNPVTWHGTVEYIGVDGKEITGVMAADSGNKLENATLDADGRTWSLRVGEFYVPSFFTVSMRLQTGELDDGEGNVTATYTYQKSKGFPLPDGVQVASHTSPENPIPLVVNGADLGILINTPDELFTYLNTNQNPNASYALGGHINLATRSDKTQDWKGPTFRGKFYGGGYTISNLTLTNLSRDNGLFGTLQSASNSTTVLENFTLEVSALGYLDRTAISRFGGVVGIINDGSASVEIRNVTVTGKMEVGTGIGSSGSNFSGGGLIGEINNSKRILIENCVSEISIDVIDNPNSSCQVVGGFIGRVIPQGSNIIIRNSYATGNISVVSSKANCTTAAGAFIADVLSGSTTGTLTLEQSYGSGNVSVATGNATSGEHGAGGLIGLIHGTGGTMTITIKNCAAVGEEVLFSSNSTTKSNGRLAGYIPHSNITVNLSNNIARSGMLIGAAPGTPDDGADTVDGTSTLAATGFRGIGVSAEDLRLRSTWTGPLGWKETDWDFSGLNATPPVWPKLRKSVDETASETVSE